MEAAVCRDDLHRLLAEEIRYLDELALLLQREHEYLTENDVASLERAAADRQRCVAQLVRLDTERRSLCRQAGKSEDLQGLEALLAWCDPQRTLASGWSKCLQAAETCRNLNDRNGTLVGARLKHVQDRLGVLIEGRRQAFTYGPRGAYAPGEPGRVVATEA